MATEGSGRATCKSGGSGEEFCTSPFRPDVNEEPLNVSEARQYVVEEQIDLHGELAHVYKGSTVSTSQSPIQDSKLIDSDTTRLPITSMASLSHPATMENLPDKLLLNIFMRLLAKQLAQMRIVSKPWNALLSHSSFIKSHLDHSIHNNDQVLLLFYNSVCLSDSKPFTAHLSRSPQFQLTEFNKLVPFDPRTFPTFSISIRVHGAVNGLICSSYNDSTIHIWNPSLSAVLTLPPYPMSFHRSYKVYFRFGYDPKANDYKVVKLIGIPHTEYFCKECLHIGVYSMRKGSWEPVNERFLSHFEGIFDDDFVCLDGHDGLLHWRGYGTIGRRDSQTIVAFDLGSHTFCEIPLPDSVIKGEFCLNKLGVLDGKLCVMPWLLNAYEVWVMEEYGVAESWVKRHVFPQSIGRRCPYGFTSHAELVIYNIYNNDEHLVLYDSIANETKIFEDDFCNRTRHRPQKIVEYVDSLVWVAPSAGQI